MNSITIAGIVGKDDEVKVLQDGTNIASFSVADSQAKDKTIWWNVSLWGRRAESLHASITKGTKVTVTGVVSEETWNDRTSGETRKAFRVRANDILLQGNRPESKPVPQQADVPDDDTPF